MDSLSVTLHNDNNSLCTLLVPPHGSTLKVGPKSSIKITSETLEKISHYVKAFKLRVEYDQEDLKDHAHEAQKVIAPLTEVKPVEEVIHTPDPQEERVEEIVEKEVEEVAAEESKDDSTSNFSQEELETMLKGEVVEIAESLGLDPHGTKAELIERILGGN